MPGPRAWPRWQRRRVALERCHKAGEFRVYYTLHGQDALPERQRGDSNGDGVVNYHRPTDPPAGVNVLTIDVKRGLSSRNLTPAHEFFHQVQNGYTLFKNAWYTEGLCRWAETALGKGAGKAGPLPTTPDDVRRLMAMKYKASHFWHAPAQEANEGRTIELPGDIERLKYIGTPSQVVLRTTRSLDQRS